MKALFREILKADSGFTLTEVLIGGSILAGVALASATMFKNQSKAQQKVNSDHQLVLFHNNLSKVLNDVRNCNATFRSFYGAPSIGPTDTISDINLSRCATESSVDPDLCKLSNDANDEPVNAVPFIAQNQYIDRASSRQIWQVTQIAPVAVVNATGPLQLRFTYTLNPNIGSRIISKDVTLNLRFDPTEGFKECFNDQESAVNNLSKVMCDTLNPTGVASDGLLVYWDEKDQKCKLTGSEPSSPPLKDCSAYGMMIEGIGPDGVVHCRSISDGFDPSSNIYTGTNDVCATGDRARLQWDATTQTVRAICAP